MGWDWVKVLKEEMLDLKSDEHLSRHAATDRLAWVSSQAPARAPMPADDWRHQDAGGGLLGFDDVMNGDPSGVSSTGFNSGPLYGGADSLPGEGAPSYAAGAYERPVDGRYTADRQDRRAEGQRYPADGHGHSADGHGHAADGRRGEAPPYPVRLAPAAGELPSLNDFDFAMPTAPPLQYPAVQPQGGLSSPVPDPALGGLPMIRGFRADDPRTAPGGAAGAPGQEPRVPGEAAETPLAHGPLEHSPLEHGPLEHGPFEQAPPGQGLSGRSPSGQSPFGAPPAADAGFPLTTNRADAVPPTPFPPAPIPSTPFPPTPTPSVLPGYDRAGHGEPAQPGRGPAGYASSAADSSGGYAPVDPAGQAYVLTLLIDGVLAGVALPGGGEVSVGRERQSTLVIPEAKQTVSRRAVTLVRTAPRTVQARIENRNGAWVTRQMPEGTRQEFVERGSSVTLRIGDRLALDPPGTVVVGLGEPH